MGYHNFKKTKQTNGAVHIVLNIMINVMGSAKKAEIGDLFTISRKRNLSVPPSTIWATHNQIHP